VRFTMATHPTVDGLGVLHAGRGVVDRIAFQMTLSDRHSMNTAGLTAACRVMTATADTPLHLCIVVPSCRFLGWKRKVIRLPAACMDTVKVFVVAIAGDEVERQHWVPSIPIHGT
jgi:hypothetical protein